jgi:hypothetical protein
MSKEEEQLKNDITWLMSLFQQAPAQADIEVAAQAIGIWKSINPNLSSLERKDIVKIAITGWLASLARKQDKERLDQLNPFAFYHVAHFIADNDDTGEEYKKFIGKVVKSQ